MAIYTKSSLPITKKSYKFPIVIPTIAKEISRLLTLFMENRSTERILPLIKISKETIEDGEGSYTLEYAYNRKGRLKTLILPDQSKIAYTYDAVFGREVHRISSQGDILYTHIYDSYDSQGKLLSENHIGYAGSHAYTYNLNGQKTASKSDFFTEKYIRDVLGRITEVKGRKA